MGSTNALSHKDEVDTSLDNIEQVLLPNLQINMLDAALAQKITESTPFNQFVIDTLAALDAKTVPLLWFQKEDWYFNQGALYYKSHLCIPKPVQHSLVKNIHESLASTSGGYFCTIFLLQKDYWWPGMTTFVCQFITGYTTCQANKVNVHPTIPPLSPILSKCSHPFQQIWMDLITNLPPSDGYNFIVVIVDHSLLKGVIFCPCNKTASSADIAKVFFHHVFPQFGLHNWVISN